jgi:hypothetical protein
MRASGIACNCGPFRSLYRLLLRVPSLGTCRSRQRGAVRLIQSSCSPRMRGLAIPSTQKLLDHAQFRFHRCAIRRPLDCLAQVSPRLLQLPCLALQYAQQKEGIGMARVQRQHLPVHGFRRRVSSCAMVLGSDLQNRRQQLRYRNKGSGEGTGHCNHLSTTGQYLAKPR